VERSAFTSPTHRDVAFALIKTEGLDVTGRERIAREAQAMGRLGAHPNIVTVFDLGVEPATAPHPDPLPSLGEGRGEGQPYMVTELMAGGDIEGAIAAAPEHKLSLPVALAIAEQVCRGLEFAHARGIVHRDLKPGNVWLTAALTPGPSPDAERAETPVAKIGDFGLAVAIDRTRLTQAGMMVGTVSYMPPEQAMGGEVTAQSDLYSLGAMLYELVTGRPPFLGEDHVAVIGQHLNTPPVAPSWHRPDCPRPLEALILRLLAKDPRERPPSAADVRHALGAIDLSASKDGAVAQLAEANALDSLAGGVFVGRQREMGELKAALEDVLSGRGRLVMLVGEPGIGKTRTAQELATYAGLRGAQVLWGRCYDSAGVPPYWPWVQAIRSYVREAEAERLRSELGSGAADIAEIAAEVRERIPDLKPLPALEPEQARFRLFDSVASFLKAAGGHQPLVLVLDDLHWADRPSLLMLEFVARELGGARLLLIGSYRDVDVSRQHPLALSLGELTRERLFQRLLLRGLGMEDVAKFIELTAGLNPPAGLVEAVHTQTEGNPLFVTEVVRLLVQEGSLSSLHPPPEREGPGVGGDTTRRSKGPSPTPTAREGEDAWTVRIPEGVREVIGRRLSRLSERCNQVLTLAAVIGREFTLELVAALVDDLPGERLLEVTEEALAARIVEELPRAVGRYQFTHALIQETLAAELTTTRRVQLHARIAEALERLYGAEADAHAAELAQHYGEAETLAGGDKVAHYSLVAGNRALASHAPEEALQHLQRALAAKEGASARAVAGSASGPAYVPDAETADILFGLGRAQAAVVTGDHMQEAFANIGRAFEYYANEADVEHAVAVASFPVFVTRPGAVRGGAALIARALPLAPPDSLQAGRLWCCYGYHLGQHEGDARSDDAFERALAIARRERDTSLELQTLGFAAGVDYQLVRLQSGLEKATRAIELARDVDDPVAESQAQASACLVMISSGDFKGLRAHADRLLELAERLRNRGILGEAYWALATCAAVEGDWQRAREYCERGLEQFPGTRLSSLRYLLEYQAGDFSAGDAFREKARGLLGREPTAYNSVPWSSWGTLLAVVARIQGVEPAELDDPTLAAIVRLMPPVPEMLDCLSLGASLTAVARKDGRKAAELLDSLSRRRGTFEHLCGPFSYDRLFGLLAQTAGQLDAASGHFEDALGACERGGHRPEWAWSAYEYSLLLSERGGEGDRQKAVMLSDRALSVARELGMRPLVEQVLSRREILKA